MIAGVQKRKLILRRIKCELNEEKHFEGFINGKAMKHFAHLKS